MRLHVNLIVTAALLVKCAVSQTSGPSGWEQVLTSVNLAGEARIHVAGANEAASPDWTSKVQQGAVLILDGESRLAFSLGFRPSKQKVTVTSMTDVHAPTLRIVLEKPLDLSRWDVPAGSTVFAAERWTKRARRMVRRIPVG